jgi:hypothetical protein
VVYYPNATLSMSGSAGASSCLEVIAGSLTFSNSASLGASCSSYGAATFSSLPGTPTASLVQ